MIEITTIERTDTREEMKLKIEVQTGHWLSNNYFNGWLKLKIKAIFAKVKVEPELVL